MVDGLATCLASLAEPNNICRAVETSIQGVFKKPKQELAFLLQLGKTLARQQHTSHAMAIFRELAENPAAPPALVERLQAVLAKSTGNEPPLADAPPEKDSPRAAPPKKGRFAGFLDRFKRK